MKLDTLTKVLLDMIESVGYAVTIRKEDDAYRLTAVDSRTQETFIVRSKDAYDGSVELAEQVGIELEDG